jgi:hypothetical protein
MMFTIYYVWFMLYGSWSRVWYMVLIYGFRLMIYESIFVVYCFFCVVYRSWFRIEGLVGCIMSRWTFQGDKIRVQGQGFWA